MVLFQVAINGYDADGRIRVKVPCPNYGRHRVRFLNYGIGWTTTNPLILMKVVSENLYGEYVGGQLIITSEPRAVVVLNTSKYEFSCNLSGYVDIELININETIPANFKNAYFSFDLQKE